ncbi:hypothetical protein [Phenylobacterium sp.]|uniref:hypothetical protein n=1 Tax=Phenylobacterium sp. TaxID=1871053 RepID=UPI003001C34F
MNAFNPMKPREPGTVWEAISAAMDQIGGAEKMAQAANRKTWWAYTVSDEDAAANARTSLSFADACVLAEKGGVALAEHIALKAGGVFIPAGAIDDAVLKAELASFSSESGDLVSEIIRRTADDEFCAKDGAAALPLVKGALRSLLSLYHQCTNRAHPG